MQLNEHYLWVSYEDRVKHFECDNVEFGSYDGDTFTCHNHSVSSNATENRVTVVVTRISEMREILSEDMDIREFQSFIDNNRAIDNSNGNRNNYSVFAGNVVFYSVG